MKRSMQDLEPAPCPEKKSDGGRRKTSTQQDGASPAADIHSAGNQAIQSILRKAMPPSKANVSMPGDSYEREADRLAEQATSPEIQRKPAAPSSAPRAEAGEVSHILQASTGSPLDSVTRHHMESQLGQDFSDVRVHSDDRAAQSARQLNADAYTVGKDIVFGAGQYAPQTSTGERLLAHELVHVAQQSKGKAVSGGPIQRQQSINQTLTDVAGVPTTMESVSFHATLAAGQNLLSDSQKTIHTVSDTRVEATVTSTRLTIDFNPELVITSASWPHPNIWVEQIYFDFSTAMIGWSVNARGGTWAAGWVSSLFGGSGVHESMGSGLSSLFSGLPSAMRTPGYDPFADTNLSSNVTSFLSSLSSGGGSPGAGIPVASSVGMSAEFSLGGEVRQSSGSFSLVIPSGTRVGVDISLKGGIPGSLSDIRVDRIRVTLSNPSGSSANVELQIMGTGIPLIFLRSATYSAGGGLQFDYDEVLELGEALVRLLGAAEVVREGRGGELGEGALDYRQPRVHALIDEQIRQNLEPLLRNLILSNRHAIPGMDLGEALGYGSEMGDFEIVPPAGPGSAYG